LWGRSRGCRGSPARARRKITRANRGDLGVRWSVLHVGRKPARRSPRCRPTASGQNLERIGRSPAPHRRVRPARSDRPQRRAERGCRSGTRRRGRRRGDRADHDAARYGPGHDRLDQRERRASVDGQTRRDLRGPHDPVRRRDLRAGANPRLDSESRRGGHRGHGRRVRYVATPGRSHGHGNRPRTGTRLGWPRAHARVPSRVRDRDRRRASRRSRERSLRGRLQRVCGR